LAPTLLGVIIDPAPRD